MKVVYTGEEMPEKFTSSMFLAGPSLRPDQEHIESWRNDAIKILEDKGYDGVVFIPENRDGKFSENFSYDDQVDWEHKHLNVADCIVFWVPRDLSLDKHNKIKLPAFTTNVEWGAWASSGKVVFGSPSDVKARKNTYLKYYADFYNVDGGETITETLDAALDMLKDSCERSGGERFVPLFIWNTTSFQSWYAAQTDAGNRLDHAELLWSFRPGYKKFVFTWVLKVDIYIESEDRHKTNEFVLARTDISSVCLYTESDDPMESEVILIREFRSPAATADGFIRELPSGSKNGLSVDNVIFDEVLEETGFSIKIEKLNKIFDRQLCGTLSTHKSYLFSYKLNSQEIEWFKSQKGVRHGVISESEITYIEVIKVKELLSNNLLDWSTIGQILSVIYTMHVEENK